MDLYQFIQEIDKIWDQIIELEEKAPDECSVIGAIAMRCINALRESYDVAFEVKPK